MNTKERLFAAIEQRPVDRMPAMTYSFHPYTFQWQRNKDGTLSGLPG